MQLSTRTRFAPICCLVICALVAVSSHNLMAQDDPFGDAPGSPGEPAAAAASNPAGTDPLIQQLLESARRGPPQMAVAIASLARTGNWSSANRLLESLAGRNYDAQVLSEMQRQIGPALYVRMKQRSDLSGKAKSALDKLAAASTSNAESPERLRTAIAGLDSASTDTQLSSARKLLAGGNASIAELVAAAVAEKPTVPRAKILQVLLNLGPGGVDALRQLALYGDPATRSGAVESLAMIDSDEYLVDLLTALYATDSTETERSIAIRRLQQTGDRIPSQDSALEYLEFDFQNRRERARRIDNDDARQTIWSVTADRKRVTSQSARDIYGAYRDVADAASRLRRVGLISSDVLAADLSYRVLIDNDWGTADQIEQIHRQYGGLAESGSISRGIANALDANDHLSAVGLIRLANGEPTVLNQNLLLSSGGATPSPLVRAASSPDPRVRYEAATSVARLAAGAAYPGSSRVGRCLREMRSLGDLPTAVLVETRPDVILRLETLLGQLGYETTVVHSVRALQQCVDRGGDLRLILSKTNLPDLAPLETIDYVRRLHHGRSLPIVFYGDQFAGIDSARWEAPTLLIDQPTSFVAFDELFKEIERRQRLAPLTAIDRQRFRREAMDLLTN